MDIKKIKTSKRGLTFSIENEENFRPGSRYTYLVADNKIIIKSIEEGGLKVSRKKVGKKIKSLFDLRSKSVLKKLSRADYLEIEVKESEIIVYLKKKVTSIFKKSVLHPVEEVLSSKVIATYTIPKMMMAAGSELYQYNIFDYINETVDNNINMGRNSKLRHLKADIRDVFSVVSLFSGAGMLDYPFKLDPTFNIEFAIDYDKDATESYKANIGNHIICGDVRNVTDIGNADVVIGGPSCKSFSNANRSSTRLLNHPDYFLVNEYIRIVKETNPQCFVIENVPEFISANEGELLNAVIEELSDYETTVNIIVDSEVGGYTKRKRAFLIGSKIGKIELPKLKVATPKTVREALAKVDSSWFNFDDITVSKKETLTKISYVPNGGNWQNIPVELRDKGVHSNHFRRLDPDGLCPTLTNFRKVCLLPPTESENPNRILSVAEASALSGLDKNFKFLGSLNSKQQQVGNGVPFYMGKFVKDAIKKALLKANPLRLGLT